MKTGSKVAHNRPQTSPEFIFHIINMSQDSSVSKLPIYLTRKISNRFFKLTTMRELQKKKRDP